MRFSAKRKLAAGAVAGICVVAAVAVALFAFSGSSAAPVAANVDTSLCPFPLQVTIRDRGHATAVRGLDFLGPSTITLRNTSTGRTATLHSAGSYEVDAATGGVTFQGHRIWLLASGKHVPFMSTDGSGSFVPVETDLALRDAGLRARVIDPCALVAPSPPSTQPAATKAPWGLPAYQLSQIAYSGLTPVLAALVRHDHVHLDVIVDGRAVTVPAGVGLVEPVDNGPCPSTGGSPLGDCAGGHFYTFGVAVAPVHTHSTSGLIHIESDRPGTFTLGEFFDEWGVRLTPTCVGGYCTGGGEQLRVFVDGRRVAGDPRSIVLTNHQEIAVVFGRPDQFGSVPSGYTGGWPGAGCGGAGESPCL